MVCAPVSVRVNIRGSERRCAGGPGKAAKCQGKAAKCSGRSRKGSGKAAERRWKGADPLRAVDVRPLADRRRLRSCGLVSGPRESAALPGNGRRSNGRHSVTEAQRFTALGQFAPSPKPRGLLTSAAVPSNRMQRGGVTAHARAQPKSTHLLDRLVVVLLDIGRREPAPTVSVEVLRPGRRPRWHRQAPPHDLCSTHMV